MLTLLAKLLKALNSESSTRQIALAISLALIVGLSPLMSLHNLVILFFVFVIKINFSSFILAFGLFSGLGYLLAPLSMSIGESLLTAQGLQGLFTGLYQLSWFKLAHLHNTYTLGALVLGVVLSVPTYFISKWLIENYRVHIKDYFEKLSLVKALKASKFFTLYQQASGQGV